MVGDEPQRQTRDAVLQEAGHGESRQDGAQGSSSDHVTATTSVQVKPQQPVTTILNVGGFQSLEQSGLVHERGETAPHLRTPPTAGSQRVGQQPSWLSGVDVLRWFAKLGSILNTGTGVPQGEMAPSPFPGASPFSSPPGGPNFSPSISSKTSSYTTSSNAAIVVKHTGRGYSSRSTKATTWCATAVEGLWRAERAIAYGIAGDKDTVETGATEEYVTRAYLATTRWTIGRYSNCTVGSRCIGWVTTYWTMWGCYSSGCYGKFTLRLSSRPRAKVETTARSWGKLVLQMRGNLRGMH